MTTDWNLRNHSYPTSVNYTTDGFIDYSLLILEERTTTFKFEESFDIYALKWIYKYWYLGPLTGLLYIGFVFALEHWMSTRKAFNLKRELFWWNAALGVFSIVGLSRVLPEYRYFMNQEDWIYRSLCTLQPINKASFFWGLMWTFSKYIELGDTVFIVLRKRPLTAIQWYHHFVTLSAAWLMTPYVEPVSGFLVTLNYGVHSLMYPYFAIRALDLKPPTIIANIITTLQFTQMITALILIVYSASLYYVGVPCYRHPFPLNLSLFICLSFNFLFGNLFNKSVIQMRFKALKNKSD